MPANMEKSSCNNDFCRLKKRNEFKKIKTQGFLSAIRKNLKLLCLYNFISGKSRRAGMPPRRVSEYPQLIFHSV
jgi:hypothetical protein